MIDHLAIVGATGAVGREFCRLIDERRLAVDRLSLLASPRSAGSQINVMDRDHVVAELGEGSFDGVRYAIFSAGAGRSREWAPFAVGAGALVIDNSSAFRMDRSVPLVIPEVNPDDLSKHDGIIANPNCSTILANLVAWPLHRKNRIRRMVVCTYQSVSGAGAAAVEELRSQTADVLAGREVTPQVFPHPIAFNLFSHDTPVGADGYNTEERKMIDETRKIFHEPNLAISATCIRVPIERAHSESLNLTFAEPITPGAIRDVLAKAPGVTVVDDAENGRFPMPLDASGKDDVLVGRIRQDAGQADGCGIELFLSGDQLRKGAALNAIQILELFCR